MTSRPTPDILAELRERIIWHIASLLDYPSIYMGGPSSRSRSRAERPADAILTLLTPLLDATHEAACRAMREEAAKRLDAGVAWYSAAGKDASRAGDDLLALAYLAQERSHRENAAKIRAIPLPKREV